MSEDFDFYDGNEEVLEDRIPSSVSDRVDNLTYTSLDYPCIVFKDGFTCPQHHLRAISNMIKTVSVSKDINLYFSQEGELYKMGMLSGVQVIPFLSIVGEDAVTGYMDKDTKLMGDLLYSLSLIL